MGDVQAFLLGLAVTAGLSMAGVWYLQSSLKGILTDLCGNERRADFWMNFSKVILVLTPAVFAMHFDSPAAAENVPAVLRVTQPLKWSFAGLVTSVLALGLILSRFISRDAGRGPGQAKNPAER